MQSNRNIRYTQKTMNTITSGGKTIYVIPCGWDRKVRVEVSEDFATAIEVFDRRQAMRNYFYNLSHYAASGFGIDPRHVVDHRNKDRGWHAYYFSVLLGSSGIWDGPRKTTHRVNGVARCRGCGHLPGNRLPSSHYCLFCDRTGRDRLIGRPPKRRPPNPPELRGGVG